MKTYLSIFRIRLINGLQYRAVALGAIFARFFWAFFEILAFSAVYAAGDADFSMTFPQTAAYMWMQQALYTVFSVVCGDEDIYDSIRSGGIAYELVRPADLYTRWLFSAAGNRVAPLCTGFLPMLLIALLLPEPYRLLLPGSAAQLLLFLISAVLGLFVTVSISTLMHISMFFTLSHRGTRVIFTAVTSLLSGGLIPLAFFRTPCAASCSGCRLRRCATSRCVSTAARFPARRCGRGFSRRCSGLRRSSRWASCACACR